MQVKIIKTHKTEEVVDVELPHYYQHDCGGDDYDSMYYGKIEAARTTVIALRKNYGRADVSCEVEVQKCSPAAKAEYFQDEYRSTQVEYERAKRQALEMLNGA